MTRMDSVHSATDNARESVRHAAEVVAPKVSLAAGQARSTVRGQYATHVAPRLVHARETLPPAVDLAAARTAKRTREAAKAATVYTAPRIEAARAAAGPAKDAALARSAAAVAALRGDLTTEDIRRLARRRVRRARTGRAAKRFLVVGALAGGAVAVWKWWDRQSNPDWLIEPPAATEVGGGAGANGASPASEAPSETGRSEAGQSGSETARGGGEGER